MMASRAIRPKDRELLLSLKDNEEVKKLEDKVE
jgi:hypothetical protein